MKSIKYLVVLACIIFGLANVAKAQIYNDKTHFYVRQDDTDLKGYIYIFRFKGNHMYCIDMGRNSEVKSLLAKTPNCFDDFTPTTKVDCSSRGYHPIDYVYDNRMSTSSRLVYEDAFTYDHNYANWRHYWAFSKDLSSVIEFYMNSERTKEQGTRQYYIKVTKEDLLPKAINPNEIDFLND